MKGRAALLLLVACQAGAAPLAQCAQQAAQSSGREPDEVLADAMLWLPMAAAAGLVTIDA